jgi:tellurite resistance protein
VPTRTEAICDLLLAAAHADGEFAPSEKQVIIDILCAIENTETLSPALTARITFTKPETIDVMETASLFEDDPEDNRRLLMELISAVNQADGKYAIEEDEIAIFAAAALGFNTDEIKGFAMSFEEAKMAERARKLKAPPSPPPIPKKA